MELPQYIAKQNPKAALLSDAAPRASLTGVENLSKTLTGIIDGVKEYSEELNINRAKKEYELWLTEEQQRFSNETTIENLEEASKSFNHQATLKIDEYLRKNGVSWTKFQKTSAQMQAVYAPKNLAFSIGVGEKVKAQAFNLDETNYQNNLGNIMSTATVAQLKGADGHIFLTNSLQEAEDYVDRAIASGYLPASARDYAIAQKKMQVTSMFFGRLLKEDPVAAYNFVTHNAAQVEKDKEKLYKTHGETDTYQSIYSVNQENFAAYQAELKKLSEHDKLRLGIKNDVKVKGESSQNSYQYNLGALYQDAQQQGISFSEAIKDEELLRKYATPYSPHFSKSSMYCTNDTIDYAGQWVNGQFVPASLTNTSKYYDKTLGFLNTNMIKAVTDAYDTYLSNKQKQDQTDNLDLRKKLHQNSLQIQSDATTGVPTDVMYVVPADKTTPANDPYKNIPVPTAFPSITDIKKWIEQEARALGIPLAAAMAIFKRESNFNPKAKGTSGEYGLGQLMPGTAKALGVTNPWDSLQNIKASLKYFKQALDQAGGDIKAAYAGYNGGHGVINAYKNGKGTAQLRNNVEGFNKIYIGFKQQYGNK